MTQKKEPNAMEALDAGIAESDALARRDAEDAAAREVLDEADAAMPPGHEQIDSDMTPAQMFRIRANMYFFHVIVGIVLLPFALILRTGRWSMRTLVAHHNGWEFGSW